MGPKLPENASDYAFRIDARPALDTLRNQTWQHRDNYRRTLSAFELQKTVKTKDGQTYSLTNELHGFTGPAGELSFGRQYEYSKYIEAQRVADANGDRKFDVNEYEIFNAIRTQGTNTVGGVKLNINNQNIGNIRSIKKLEDGRFMVSLGMSDTTSTFVFKPQPEESKASIDIPDIGDKVEFRGMSKDDYTVNPKE